MTAARSSRSMQVRQGAVHAGDLVAAEKRAQLFTFKTALAQNRAKRLSALLLPDGFRAPRGVRRSWLDIIGTSALLEGADLEDVLLRKATPRPTAALRLAWSALRTAGIEDTAIAYHFGVRIDAVAATRERAAGGST